MSRIKVDKGLKRLSKKLQEVYNHQIRCGIFIENPALEKDLMELYKIFNSIVSDKLAVRDSAYNIIGEISKFLQTADSIDKRKIEK